MRRSHAINAVPFDSCRSTTLDALFTARPDAPVVLSRPTQVVYSSKTRSKLKQSTPEGFVTQTPPPPPPPAATSHSTCQSRHRNATRRRLRLSQVSPLLISFVIATIKISSSRFSPSNVISLAVSPCRLGCSAPGCPSLPNSTDELTTAELPIGVQNASTLRNGCSSVSCERATLAS